MQLAATVLSYLKIQQTSEIYKACFNIFYSDNAKRVLFATTEALALQSVSKHRIIDETCDFVEFKHFI